MKYMTHKEIRQKWFDFFKSKGHVVVQSAPLVPIDDDSLFFINAGVTPLKKYFDGSVVPENKRMVSIQKCIRTNDIENVGLTKRHQTLFEMMGNFSIGDYFKEEALEFAFELLTSEEWFGINKDLIYVSVFTTDDTSYNKWIELGLDESHIVRLDGNFWEIGEGPCGPDSEIFFDRGKDYDPDGDALEKFKRDEDQERYIEIWNNVFSQYNSISGIDRSQYKELPHKNIDTGAGLERWCIIFQGVDSTFDTDLFVPIINRIESLTNTKYNGEFYFKVIADHIRAISLALADGAMFENTNRGYVLRRLLRRSVRMGRKLGMNEAFLYKLVDEVAFVMGETYTDLIDKKSEIKSLVLEEENLFYKTLSSGERKLNQLIKDSHDKTISGYDVFKLYDTYGFPIELTLEYLEEEGLTTNIEECNRYMEEAKKVAKESSKKESSMSHQNEELIAFTEKSDFLYDAFEVEGKVIGIFKDETFVDKTSDYAYLIFDKTCFYAESGGQVSDTGGIKNDSFKAKVTGVVKAPNGQHLHRVEVLEGDVKLGDVCTLKIVKEKRLKIRANHSSIHILHKVLRDYFSSSLQQAGSYVDDERFRFDFTYTGKISDEDTIKIEEKVNEVIKDKLITEVLTMPLEEAIKMGAIALFTDKYKDVVRVLRIGDSLELCGGTHIESTDEIERFAITKIESKGSNLYRIEGTTNDLVPVLISESVAKYVDEIKKQLLKAEKIIEDAKREGIELNFNVILDQEGLTSYKDIVYNKNQVEYIHTEVNNLEKKYKEEKLRQNDDVIDKYLANKKDIDGIESLIIEVEDADNNVLRDVCDKIINKTNKGFIFIANKKDGNVNFFCKSDPSLNLSAGLLMKRVSNMAGGNGGGSKTFAQGGGVSTTNLKEILKTVEDEVKNTN